MKWPELCPDDVFPLWLFKQPGGFVLTRGRTLEEAQSYVRHSVPIMFCPLDAATWYTAKNHEDGWLHRPMFWLCEHLGLNPEDYGHVRRR